MNPDLLPQEEVRRHMTPGPVTVAATTPITEVARIMSQAHIHRVIVADVRQCPVGIVTSTDVLAAVANPEGNRHKVNAAPRLPRRDGTC